MDGSSEMLAVSSQLFSTWIWNKQPIREVALNQKLFCDSSLESTPFSVKMDTGDIMPPPQIIENKFLLYIKNVFAYLSCYVSTQP